MKYYIIAGEASGDLHGSNLIKALRGIDPQAEIRAWGGDKMQAAGAQLAKHYRETAYMGFVEVIKHLRSIFKLITFCKQDVAAFSPDVLVLIDYPGFNLRIAKWAKARGMRVVYYISPQVWAWKASRVETIRSATDKMLVILPFEKAFYKKHGLDVIYTGHPLAKVIREAKQKPATLKGARSLVALLPGSREQEIRTKLPVMLSVTEDFPEVEFAVAQAPSLPDSLFAEIIGARKIRLIKDDTYNLLNSADAALVTSGTATLETALFGTPQVVCYKGNGLSFWLAKRLVKVPFISLVNLIAEKEVVRELIQNDLTHENLKTVLSKLLYDESVKLRMRADYDRLRSLLESEDASEKAAAEIFETAKKPT